MFPVYSHRINNRLVLELETPETMELFVSTKKLIVNI